MGGRGGAAPRVPRLEATTAVTGSNGGAATLGVASGR